MIPNYPRPLDRLLLRGYPRDAVDWPDYVAEYGLTAAQIPDLIRMATDDDLSWLEQDDPRVWGPIHARRALGQLQAAEAVQPLLEELDQNEALDEKDDDWTTEEIPTALAMIGPAGFAAVAAFVRDAHGARWARAGAATALAKIAQAAPSLRDEALRHLTESLEKVTDPVLNGNLVCEIVDLKGIEALPAMREAYLQGRVDPAFLGDFQDVEIALGVRTARSSSHRGPDLGTRFRLGIDGKAPPSSDWARVGRNELCPCGSGIKFKKCCLAKVPKA